MVSANGNATAQKFKYNGVEFEESLGLNLYEMDVRAYDPAIARWTGIDPVTHHSMSTYTAFDNNPVIFADPSGADSEFGMHDWSNANAYFESKGTQEANDENEEEGCCGWQSYLVGKIAGFFGSSKKTITNESITNFLGGLRDSSKKGLNDGIDDIITFLNEDIISGQFYLNGASGFFSNIANGQSFFFNASPEYLYGLGVSIGNMSANDWAYAISNQIPANALMFGAGTGFSSLRFGSFRFPKFNFSSSTSNIASEGMMFRHGKNRLVLRNAKGQFATGTGTVMTDSMYHQYFGLNSLGQAYYGTPINYSVIGGSKWVKWGAAAGLSGSIIYWGNQKMKKK